MRQVRHARAQHQLAKAVVSRSVIDQAIDTLMGQQRHAATATFDMQRKASQNRNRKHKTIIPGAPADPR